MRHKTLDFVNLLVLLVVALVLAFGLLWRASLQDKELARISECAERELVKQGAPRELLPEFYEFCAGL